MKDAEREQENGNCSSTELIYLNFKLGDRNNVAFSNFVATQNVQLISFVPFAEHKAS